MAEAVEQQLAAPAQRRRLRLPRGRRAYGGRFLLAYLVLALFAAAAVAAGVALLTGDPPDDARWSAWEPAGSADRASQIAAHVAPRYRLPNGSQLAAVIAGAPSVPLSEEVSLRVTHVATVSGEGDAERIETQAIGDGAVVYRMCGLGENCGLVEGTVNEDVLRVLRREALELALYTFTYLDGTETVVVVLPQPPTQQAPATALLFRRGELANELEVPLAATLPRADAPAPVKQVPKAEAFKIDQLTLTRLFSYEYRPLPDGSGFVLLLAPATG